MFRSVITLILLSVLATATDKEEELAAAEQLELKLAVTYVRCIADAEPIRKSALPESGLYLRLVKDCDSLINAINARPGPSPEQLIMGEKVLRDLDIITRGGLVTGKSAKTGGKISYNYFSGRL